MTSRKEKTHDWLETLVFIHCFMFSTLLNGVITSGAHSHSHEMEIPSGNPRQGYQLTDNKTISNGGDVSLGPGFDGTFRWTSGKEVEKGGRSCSGKSVRFRLGERFAFRKRLQFALLPIMYKMGVMTTLLTGLTVLVLKGLAIGVILLIFAFVKVRNMIPQVFSKVDPVVLLLQHFFQDVPKCCFKKRDILNLTVLNWIQNVDMILLQILCSVPMALECLSLKAPPRNYFTKLHKHSYQSAQPIHVHVHSQDGHKVSSYPSVVGPWDRVADEVHPGAFLGDDGLENYRRQLIENSAAMVKFKPLVL